MGEFDAVSDLRIGKIIEVQGTSLRIEIDSKLTDLTSSYNGRVYSIGQISSLLKIRFGRKVLFANVKMLRMSSDIEYEGEQKNIEAEDDSRIIEADLLGQGTWNRQDKFLDFSRGVTLYPLPLQSVYLMTNNELVYLYEGAEKVNRDDTISPMVPIGKYIGSNQYCKANINKLFGNHCAVLGSTGSGKSGTVAAIIHSVLQHSTPTNGKMDPKIIMIDPHGEYGKAFKHNAVIYRAYNGSDNFGDESTELVLPYWLMTADEFRSLAIGKTEFEATAQNNIIYEALTYARMVEAGVVRRFENPEGEESLQLCEGKTKEDIFNFDRDKPMPFKLEDLIIHMDKLQGRKPGSEGYLAASNKTRVQIDGILKKLRVLRSNPQLSFILKEYDDSSLSLANTLAQLVTSDQQEKNLKIIDISGLPNEVAGLLTALIARLIFQYKVWQNRNEREKDPILFVFEEAHRYVPNQGEAQYKDAQNAIRRIAKEGRKYGLGLMLVSQRPSDVENTVLSQCNSWIVLRLTNSHDQSYISSFIPDNLSGLTKILPSLARREAIFVGEAAAIPSRIEIEKLDKDRLPDSSDINFVKGWSSEQLSVEEIKGITDRWTTNVN